MTIGEYTFQEVSLGEFGEWPDWESHDTSDVLKYKWRGRTATGYGWVRGTRQSGRRSERIYERKLTQYRWIDSIPFVCGCRVQYWEVVEDKKYALERSEMESVVYARSQAAAETWLAVKTAAAIHTIANAPALLTMKGLFAELVEDAALGAAEASSVLGGWDFEDISSVITPWRVANSGTFAPVGFFYHAYPLTQWFAKDILNDRPMTREQCIEHENIARQSQAEWFSRHAGRYQVHNEEGFFTLP